MHRSSVAVLAATAVCLFAGSNASGKTEALDQSASFSYLSAVLNSDNETIALVKGRQAGALAWASFKDTTFSDGWAYLQVRTNPRHPDEMTSYAAGALEAELSRDMMTKQFNNLYANYCANRTDYCKKVERYIQQQTDYLYEKSEKLRATVPFWNQVYLMLQQLTGLDDQFEGAKSLNASHRYRYTMGKASMYYNWEGDMLDLEGALKREPNRHSLNQVGRCSALVKMVDNDIYFSHVSWFLYKAMLRVQKRYQFPFHETAAAGSRRVVGHTVSMSSYPGKLVSLDDFYLVSSGLAITETTNNNENATLWALISPRSVPTWIRAMAANRVSRDAAQWSTNFRQENSGTYNNQWMVLDYRRFARTAEGGHLADGAFWVVEQMPTLFHAEDMTDKLRRDGFWSSFNIPYFEDIYNISGLVPLYEKYGDYYSHDKCARAKIFRRDQHKVTNVKTMIAMMRYNDFKNDPASRCNCTPPYNPTYAISSRYDLVDPSGHYDLPNIKRKAAGAIDLKMTNLRRFHEGRFIAANGPTSDTQPVFSWKASGFNDLPEGHPDSFAFAPVDRRWHPL